MVCATVPEAAPTVRNHRATSCPAPISAKLPKIASSRLIASALACVSVSLAGASLMGIDRQCHRRAGKRQAYSDLELGRRGTTARDSHLFLGDGLFRHREDLGRFPACCSES